MTDTPTREASVRFEAQSRGDGWEAVYGPTWMDDKKWIVIGDSEGWNVNRKDEHGWQTSRPALDILTDTGLLDAMELLEMSADNNRKADSEDNGEPEGWEVCTWRLDDSGRSQDGIGSKPTLRESIEAAWLDAVNRSEQS